MKPTIEDGILVITETGSTDPRPSYIKVTTIDGIRHRDHHSCLISYGFGGLIVASVDAATVRALVWPRKLAPPAPVIGPWERQLSGWVRRLDGREFASAHPHDTNGWIWTAGVESGRCGNEQEAKDRADMALTPTRWALS